MSWKALLLLLLLCCSVLGMAWAQQAPVQVPSSRSSRFLEPSGTVPLMTLNAAAFTALLLLVFKQALVNAAIPWLLWWVIDERQETDTTHSANAEWMSQ